MFSFFKKQIEIIDNYILKIIDKYIKNKYFDILMPIVTTLGNLGAIWILIAAVLLFNSEYRYLGEIILLVLLIGSLISELLIKRIVKRIRPCNKDKNAKILITKPRSYSFPSGHTLSSFTAATILSLYFPQFKIIFMTLAIAITFSRLYLHVHYPTDVIAAILLSIMYTKLILIIIN
jgi:undecaprenyl-diphosphatase